MAHVKFAVAALVATLAGCASQTLSPTTTYGVDYVGTWHASQVGDARSFDDYVFETDGTLVTLRSVKDGMTVQAIAGAGLVRSTAQVSVACAFGASWRSEDEQTLLVDGTCTDGAAREIELGFAQQSVSTAMVSVRAVENQKSWMEPTSWLFEKCEPGCNE